jgi:hypothetical protein
MTLTINFSRQYRLTIVSEYGNPTGDGWYDEGESAPFSVTTPHQESEGKQHLFTGWTGSGAGSYSGPDPDRTVIMNNPITETASWETQVYLTTETEPVDGGQINPSPPGLWVDINTNVQIEAIPNTSDGYTFSHWSGDLSGSINPTSISMNDPKSVTAHFHFNDTNPPVLTDCYPPPGALAVPANAPIHLRLVDPYPGYGINQESITITLDSVPLIIDGVDQTEGSAQLISDSEGYRFTYSTDSNPESVDTLQIHVQCEDLFSPPNTLDSTYTYYTTLSHITFLKQDTLTSAGLVLFDDSTGFTVIIPQQMVSNPLPVGLGLIDTLTMLPENGHRVGSAYYISPDGIQFAQQMTTAIPFSPSDLDEAQVSHQSELIPYLFSTVSGSWTELPNLRYTSDFIETEIDHFGIVSFLRLEGTGITDYPINPLIPEVYRLLQNYPNPFNPTTIIPYHVPQESNITIIVYNSLGQQIRSLVDDAHQPGMYEIQWDGRDDVGNQVGSGLYYYVLQSGDFQSLRKAIILR